MTHVRTTISVTGLTDAEAAEGLSAFREYLGERPWLHDARAEWAAGEGRLLVTVETEGDDPKLESAAALDEVWDCVHAAFDASGTVAFDILAAEASR